MQESSSLTTRVDGYIGGASSPVASNRYKPKIDPRTGAKLKEIADADAGDLQKAADSAQLAARHWHKLRPSERGRVLVELGRVIRAHRKRLGQIESEETGNSIHLAHSLKLARLAVEEAQVPAVLFNVFQILGLVLLSIGLMISL